MEALLVDDDYENGVERSFGAGFPLFCTILGRRDRYIYWSKFSMFPCTLSHYHTISLSFSTAPLLSLFIRALLDLSCNMNEIEFSVRTHDMWIISALLQDISVGANRALQSMLDVSRSSYSDLTLQTANKVTQAAEPFLAYLQVGYTPNSSDVLRLTKQEKQELIGIQAMFLDLVRRRVIDSLALFSNKLIAKHTDISARSATAKATLQSGYQLSPGTATGVLELNAICSQSESSYQAWQNRYGREQN